MQHEVRHGADVALQGRKLRWRHLRPPRSQPSHTNRFQLRLGVPRGYWRGLAGHSGGVVKWMQRFTLKAPRLG
jgi:hypothetical protein